MEKFTPLGFLLRWLAAIVLVLCTFNPTGPFLSLGGRPHSRTSPRLPRWWASCCSPAGSSYLTATMRSIGFLGALLLLAFFGAVIWLVVSWGWIDPHNGTAMAWIVLFVFSAILAVGVSWSHMRRRLTGQADVDEVDAK